MTKPGDEFGLSANNPFPKVLDDGRVVGDELCTCGHNRTVHQSTVGGLAFGHGGCTMDGCCPCDKFTWKETIFIQSEQPVNSRPVRR